MDKTPEHTTSLQPQSGIFLRFDEPPLRMVEIATIGDLTTKWDQVDVLTLDTLTSRQFMVGFAASARAVELVKRLRYTIFTDELGHGSSECRQSGLDHDEFDEQMTHLLLIEKNSLEVVGTYRLQPVDHALRHAGIYSAQEYDLGPLEPWFSDAVECGRACVVSRFRKAGSLLAMWGGMREYMRLSGKRWLFGCCSLNSVDMDDGWRTMKELRRRDYLHESLLILPTTPCDCGDADREYAEDLGDPLPLPKLFGAYMRLGAKTISLPAIDRDFGTIDFLILADATHVNMSSMGIG